MNASLVPKATIAERFCVLSHAVGIRVTAIGDRRVRIDCELPDDVARAEAIIQSSAHILRVNAHVVHLPTSLVLTVDL